MLAQFYMGSYTLLDLELQSWNIQLTGLQEVRWPDSGTKNVSDTTFLWSGRKDGYHREGVALAIHRKLMPTYVSWTPVDEHILSARFRHTAGHISVIVAYAPTECADSALCCHIGACSRVDSRRDALLVTAS